MRQIFEGEILDIQPMENGICFVFVAEKDYDSKSLEVEFKTISFETGKMAKAPKNVYFLAKFGTRYKTVMQHCSDYTDARILYLPQDKIFVLNRKDGAAVLLDAFGLPLWMSNLSYKGSHPSDIAFVNDSLWAAFKEHDAIIKLNLSNMKEELRIGGGKNSPFKKPVRLLPTKDGISVLGAADNKVIDLNLKDYSIYERHSFEEKVYEYVRVDDFEFAVLNDGLYVV